MNLPQEPMLREPKCDGRRDEAGGFDLPCAVAVGDGGVQGVGEAPVFEAVIQLPA